MARLLALEWDAREARIAVARVRGKNAVVEHAFAVDLVAQDSGHDSAERNVGEQIAAALAARSVSRCDTLVAVGRASIELRRLSLPVSPPEELPDIVRFQALRQFSGIGEDWPLDFIPLESSDPESQSVLAAAISPELVQHITATCQAGERTPRRLVLRPFATASLLRRHDAGFARPCCLVVDLLADEADLTVLVDQQVTLVRTVRIASADDSGAPSRALLGEIRRTIAAAHNQLRDRRIEQIVLCGDGAEQAALGNLIQQELGLVVEFFEPFSEVSLGSELRSRKPDQPGRFAPLLGMILDEAQGTGHAIDFLHPRKRPAPPSRSRRNSLLVATAASALAAVVFLVWSQLAEHDAQIEDLNRQVSGLKKQVTEAEQLRAQAAAIDEFVESDMPWLDELLHLSRRLPPADDVILTQLNLGVRSPKGGQITLDGYTREPDQIQTVEAALRADDRDVVGTGAQLDQRREKEKYRWRFKAQSLIQPKPVGAGPGTAAHAQDTNETGKTVVAAGPASRRTSP